MKFNHNLHFFAFTHIPKCGGTSIHECLKLMLKDKYVIKTPSVPLESLNDQLWGMGGHFYFNGVHPKILNGRRPIYMTILRHPWSRFVSYFNHVAIRPEHNDHKIIRNFSNLKPIQILREWKELGHKGISNLQTQMICNKDAESATANEAIDIINKHYIFISTIDYLNDLMDEISKFFNVEKVPLKVLNATKNNDKVKLESQELYNEVLALNHKDLLLYRHIDSQIKKIGVFNKKLRD